MKYSVVYSSHTGNTKVLADHILSKLEEHNCNCIYFGGPSEKALEADVIFFGFWTDKGTCSQEVQDLIKKCDDKKVFLFGTAGFGGDQEYFERILSNVSSLLPTDAVTIGNFMCQGKMPISVRNRYESMDGIPEEKRNALIENFDLALDHPNNQDFFDLQNRVESVINQINS